MRYIYLFCFIFICVGFSQSQINAVAKVKHAVPSSTSSTGGITLTVTGGTSPYTYTWTPGNINTKDISNVSRNSYSVLIKDNAGPPATTNYYYNLGYKHKMRDGGYLSSRNDTVFASPSAPGWADAISRSTLKGGQDGWVEAVVKTTSYFYIGLLDSVSPNNATGDEDYIMDCWGGTLYTYDATVGTWNTDGTYASGDVFRISRTGTLVTIKKNNTTVRTFTSTSAKVARDWKMRMAVYNGVGDGYIANIGCSYPDSTCVGFPNYINSKHTVFHNTGWGVNDGAIKALPTNTSITNTYSWAPGGQTTQTLRGTETGSYTSYVIDNYGSAGTFKYNLLYKVRWSSTNLAPRNDTLSIITGSSAANYPCTIANDTLHGNADGAIEYILTANSANFVSWMDSVYDAYNSNDIDYAVNPSSGSLWIKTPNISWTNITSYSDGDVVRMERVGSNFSIKLNGNTVRTETVSSTMRAKNWKLKAGIYKYGTELYIGNVGISIPVGGYLGYLSYDVLKKKLDAGYYQMYDGIYYFKFIEEYVKQSSNLKYNLYKDDYTLISSTPTLAESIGDNRFQLNLNSLSLTIGNFYIVEVYNEKNERWLGRIRYKHNIMDQ